jgi:cytochrome c peroxidase
MLRAITHSEPLAVVMSMVAGVFASTLISASADRHGPGGRWSAEERAALRSLSIATLGPVPADPSNRYADQPNAGELGRRLFFDTRLSANGKVSCASCHLPSRNFQDDKPLADGVGRTARRTMPVAGTAYSPWQFWDGRADSQWAQALGPLESAVEHGGDRTQYAHVIASDYREMYETVFGRMPNLRGAPPHAGPVADSTRSAAWQQLSALGRDDISRMYANIGKAIAAYERRIGVAPSRFDRYVDAELAGRRHASDDAFSSDEEAGLRLFIGRANCSTCHNGPLFTDNHFHNTGVPAPATALPIDSGRAVGVRQVVSAEFNCTSRYSDAKPEDCDELRFADTDGAGLVRAFKTPSLRNVAERPPFMHAGQIATLADVIAHYDRAPASPFGHSELKPLRLSSTDRRQLEAFLRTLSSPLTAPQGYLEPPVAAAR